MVFHNVLSVSLREDVGFVVPLCMDPGENSQIGLNATIRTRKHSDICFQIVKHNLRVPKTQCSQ